MKVHFFGELIGEVAGQVFGYVCYGLGRRVVSVLTVGFVRPAEVGDENLYFPWYGVTRGRDGKVVLSDTAAICWRRYLYLSRCSYGSSMSCDSRVPNITFEQTVGSHTLATAAQRER